MKKLSSLIIMACAIIALITLLSKMPRAAMNTLESNEIRETSSIEIDSNDNGEVIEEPAVFDSIIDYCDNLFFGPDYFEDKRERDLFEKVMNGEK